MNRARRLCSYISFNTQLLANGYGGHRKEFNTIHPYTMVTVPRLIKLYQNSSRSIREGLTGSFVECGVCNGGSAGTILLGSRKEGAQRHLWLFDSFEGCPEPSPDDISVDGLTGITGICKGSEDQVKELLIDKLKGEQQFIHIVKGWFKDTLHKYKNEIGPIALLHLDGDWFESTMTCLTELYDNVVPGGYIQIDDYGYWKGCKNAVDEFLQIRGINTKLTKIDRGGRYLIK